VTAKQHGLKKYIVRLSDDERVELNALIDKGNHPGKRGKTLGAGVPRAVTACVQKATLKDGIVRTGVCQAGRRRALT
jgi:hypothetical protein